MRLIWARGVCFTVILCRGLLDIGILNMIAVGLRPNKKISVFWVTGQKILDRENTHIFLIIFFSGKKYNLKHFERHVAFQNA